MGVPTMTPREFANTWGYHINTVYAWIRSGEINAIKEKVFVRYHYKIMPGQLPPFRKSGPRGGRSIGKILHSVPHKLAKS